MNKSKIITNYESVTDDALEALAAAGIKGTTNNADFTFTHTELTDAAKALTDYQAALAAIATGNSSSVTDKNTARLNLLVCLSVLTAQINIQAGGDLAKLQRTGFTLVKAHEHQHMGEVLNFSVKRGVNAGSIDLSVEKPIYSHYGTVFAFWDTTLGATPVDINQWFQRHCNGHALILTGLTAGKTYPFAAAYKGSDADTLIWSDVISKMVAD